MQSISWQREEVQTQFGGCSNFSEVIELIEKDCWNKGHVVCQIMLNGELLSEEDESRLAESRIGDISSIEVKVESIDDVFTRTKLDMEAWAGKAIEFCEKCAECIHSGQIQWVNNQFIDLADGLNWFTESLYVIKNAIQNMYGKEVIGEEWSVAERSFHAIVKELIASYQAEDYVLLADSLEHDLPEMLNKWLVLLEAHGKMEA